MAETPNLDRADDFLLALDEYARSSLAIAPWLARLAGYLRELVAELTHQRAAVAALEQRLREVMEGALHLSTATRRRIHDALDAAGIAPDDDHIARVASVAAMREDQARLDWLEAVLRPLPWGGVFATIEADDEATMRLTVQPGSGDAPFINELRPSLRDAIDAARAALEEPTR